MIDENNIDQLLSDYFSGLLDESKTKEIEAWINSSNENLSRAIEAGKLHRALDVAKTFESDKCKEESLSIVHKRIRRQAIHNVIRSCSKVAAMLAIPLFILSGFLGWQLYQSNKSDSSDIVLTTGSGMTTLAQLPDGSQVWLNSNTTLRYPSKFSKTREVELDGEGFFKVQKNHGRKFIVKAGAVDVEVLGTQFDVEAYKSHGTEIRTTLLTGSVAMRYVDNEDRKHEVKIRPGERYSYDLNSSALRFEKIDTDIASSWRDGKIILKNTSLDEALRLIGNYYNVNFLVKNTKLLSNRYTGTFSGQRLDVILEHFSKTTNMKFEYVNDTGNEDVSGRQQIIVK